MNNKDRCIELLKRSIELFPQEPNELDWKEKLSEKNEKLAQHLSAFANFSGGGFLIYGVNDSGEAIGITKEEADEASEKLDKSRNTPIVGK